MVHFNFLCFFADFAGFAFLAEAVEVARDEATSPADDPRDAQAEATSPASRDDVSAAEVDAYFDDAAEPPARAGSGPAIAAQRAIAHHSSP